ncbi:MAG: thioesterase family protein [Gammaproteobacteria bacterium]
MMKLNSDFQEPAVERQLVHIVHFPMRWTDMDNFGHVNNGTYFNYFDEARVAWWYSLGAKLINPKIGPIIASATCNFRKPLIYPANLLIKIYVSTLRRSSFTVYYEIEVEQQPNIIYADGSTVVVWFDYRQNKSTPLSNELREKLTRFV